MTSTTGIEMPRSTIILRQHSEQRTVSPERFQPLGSLAPDSFCFPHMHVIGLA